LAANQPGRLYHKIHRASRDLPAHAGACFSRKFFPLGGGSGASLTMSGEKRTVPAAPPAGAEDNRGRRRSSAIGPDGPHQGSRLTLTKRSKAGLVIACKFFGFWRRSASAPTADVSMRSSGTTRRAKIPDLSAPSSRSCASSNHGG
jgi:hypothetical protein